MSRLFFTLLFPLLPPVLTYLLPTFTALLFFLVPRWYDDMNGMHSHAPSIPFHRGTEVGFSRFPANESLRARILKVYGAPNWFQGMNSASLCSLAGRYDNPLPPRFLAPVDSFKIPAQKNCIWDLPFMSYSLGRSQIVCTLYATLFLFASKRI